MLRNIVYLVLGLIVTILIFSGIFASLPRKSQQKNLPRTTTTEESTQNDR